MQHWLIWLNIKVLLGGRAAEEVIYGRDTSRASVKYLEDATCLARKILTMWALPCALSIILNCYSFHSFMCKHVCLLCNSWNLENPITIHGEPFPWRKKVSFVGPRLDFEGSLYDDYGLIEPPINFELDDRVARKTEQLLHDMYEKTRTLLSNHFAALLKTVKVLSDEVIPLQLLLFIELSIVS